MHLYFQMCEIYKNIRKYYQNKLLRLMMEMFFLSYLLIGLNYFEIQWHRHPSFNCI